MDAVPQTNPAVIYVEQKSSARGGGSPTKIETWEMNCREVGAGPGYTDSAYNHIPGSWLILESLGYKRDPRTKDFPDSTVGSAISAVKIILPPKHGRLIELGPSGAGLSFEFDADASYRGMDQFSIRVDARTRSGNAVSIVLNYKVAVVEGATSDGMPSACERWLKPARKTSSIMFPLMASKERIQLGLTTGITKVEYPR